MRTRVGYFLFACALAAPVGSVAAGGSFFRVERVEYHARESKRGMNLFEEKGTAAKPVRGAFLPFLEARVSCAEKTRGPGLTVKAYFFDAAGKMIGAAVGPHPLDRGGRSRHGTPAFFEGGVAERLCFVVPPGVAAAAGWRAVVVFGDQNEAAAGVYPDGLVSRFEFPERRLVERPRRVERKAAMDPVIEHVLKTKSPLQPRITLFLRPPVGMREAAQARGVLALCLLANSVEELKRRLQLLEASDEVGGLLRFAEKHKLLVLCWGSRGLWDPQTNWDEQPERERRRRDEDLDAVAEAWGEGVEFLAEKYGVPRRDFLLWGVSGSAQYACRLALRRPEFFLAVNVHIPSSFDEPTPGAGRVLWCLTTGERESGYERSLRFLSACRALGYPMVYKAIIGLGHQGHPAASALGERFFEYALGLKGEKEAFEASLRDSLSPVAMEWRKNPNRPWPVSFQKPAYVGDAVNQEMFPFAEADMVPPGFRVMLPTRVLADAWNAK